MKIYSVSIFEEQKELSQLHLHISIIMYSEEMVYETTTFLKNSFNIYDFRRGFCEGVPQ